jgi:predicted MFS family arabinose efflux permease
MSSSTPPRPGLANASRPRATSLSSANRLSRPRSRRGSRRDVSSAAIPTAVPATRRVPRGLAPLRHREFRLLTAGQLTSNIGDGFYAVALPWYVLAIHGGTLLLGTVLAAYGIPRTVLVAVGGHASDRWHPWTVMMAADAVRAVAVAVLAAVALSGPANADILLPVAAVIGAGEGLFLPGSFSIIPSLLPDADLQAGNALSAGGTQLATLVGPAIGGGLVAVTGPAGAFFVDAASFFISAATLAGVRASKRRAPDSHRAATCLPDETRTDSSQPGAEEPAADNKRPPALRHLIRSERILQIILAITLAANLGSGGLIDVALPALAHGPFHAGAAGYGGLIAAIGAGALLGAVAAGQTARLRRPAVAASLAFLGEAAFVAIVPYLGSTVAAGAALAVFGGLNGFGLVLVITAIQRWAPPEMLGRLMGMVLLASLAAYPMSVALAGVVVHDFGAAPFFPAAAVILAAAVLAGLTQRTWRRFGTSITTSDPA